MERKYKMDIGNKIKELRILYGLTQQELADRLELSKGFISQLERNLTSPSVGTLLDIIQCLALRRQNFLQMMNLHSLSLKMKIILKKKMRNTGA